VFSVDDFWKHLEAMAHIFRDTLTNENSLERLRHELREMGPDELKKRASELNNVAAGISMLATMESQKFDPASQA
jgi:hypothetical protein